MARAAQAAPCSSVARHELAEVHGTEASESSGGEQASSSYDTVGEITTLTGRSHMPHIIYLLFVFTLDIFCRTLYIHHMHACVWDRSITPEDALGNVYLTRAGLG